MTDGLLSYDAPDLRHHVVGGQSRRFVDNEDAIHYDFLGPRLEVSRERA
jgi:hypothetical protein